VRRDIAEKLECSGFGYAQSHQNDPLGCSVAKEVITVIKDGNLIEKKMHLEHSFLKS
jgi:acetylornithine aminotransferase